MDIQHPGVSSSGSFWGFPSWLLDDHPPSVTSHGHPSVPVCVQISFPYKDTSCTTGLGWSSCPAFTLITFLKTLSLNSYILRSCGLRLSHMNLGGGTVQPNTNIKMSTVGSQSGVAGKGSMCTWLWLQDVAPQLIFSYYILFLSFCDEFFYKLYLPGGTQWLVLWHRHWTISTWLWHVATKSVLTSAKVQFPKTAWLAFNFLYHMVLNKEMQQLNKETEHPFVLTLMITDLHWLNFLTL